MRIPSLIELMMRLLNTANPPQVASVEPLEDPGTQLKPCGLLIKLTSGEAIRLKMLGACGPGGDSFDDPKEMPNPADH